MEEFLSTYSNVKGFFNFQRTHSIDAINNETKCLDKEAHLFWEIPVIDAKLNELMDVILQWRCKIQVNYDRRNKALMLELSS